MHLFCRRVPSVPLLSVLLLAVLHSVLLVQPVYVVATKAATSGKAPPIATSTPPKDLQLKTSYDFLLEIDAGSHGSRLFIYAYEHRVSNSSFAPFSAPLLDPKVGFSTKPGIATFASEPENVYHVIKPMIKWAETQLLQKGVYRSALGEIPLHLKATAGMRVIKDNLVRDRITDSIRDWLEDPVNCPFHFERSSVRVISGEEEGVYGWITTNYVAKTLFNTPAVDTYGVLDMGGASMQITVRAPHDILANYFPLRLLHEKFRLYTHSFLHYGSDEAFRRVVAQAVGAAVGSARMNTDEALQTTHPRVAVDLPCLPQGYHEIYYLNSRLADGDPLEVAWNVTLSGTSDVAACDAALTRLLNQNTECVTNTCSISGVYQPRFDAMTFVAMGEYAKLVSFLHLPYDASLGAVQKLSRELCTMSLTDVQTFYEEGKAHKHAYAQSAESTPLVLAHRCFLTRYMYIVLKKGFGFDDLRSRILFMDNVEGDMLTWSLGAALYDANIMPFDIEADVQMDAHKICRADLPPHVKQGKGGLDRWMRSMHVRIQTPMFPDDTKEQKRAMRPQHAFHSNEVKQKSSAYVYTNQQSTLVPSFLAAVSVLAEQAPGGSSSSLTAEGAQQPTSTTLTASPTQCTSFPVGPAPYLIAVASVVLLCGIFVLSERKKAEAANMKLRQLSKELQTLIQGSATLVALRGEEGGESAFGRTLGTEDDDVEVSTSTMITREVPSAEVTGAEGEEGRPLLSTPPFLPASPREDTSGGVTALSLLRRSNSGLSLSPDMEKGPSPPPPNSNFPIYGSM